MVSPELLGLLADGVAEFRADSGFRTAGLFPVLPITPSVLRPGRPEPQAVTHRAGRDHYRSEAFERSSQFVRDVVAAPSRWEAGAVVARDPVVALAAARLVKDLPTVPVELSGSPHGQTLLRRLGPRRARLARAVLVVPPTLAEYTRGRHRQAVRTNVRHADARGITCETIDDVAERIRCVDAVILGRPPIPEDGGAGWLDHLDSGSFFVARAVDGRPLAFASLCVDVRTAYLAAFLRSERDDDASWARYALMVFTIGQLAKAGVTHLVTDNALRSAPGVQYFQHLAGFVPANLRIRRFRA